MTDELVGSCPPDEVAIQLMMRHLDGFARGLGLERAATRGIAEKVIAEMPLRSDGERLVEARVRMVAASV